MYQRPVRAILSISDLDRTSGAVWVSFCCADKPAFCRCSYCSRSISLCLQQIYRRDAGHITQAAIEI
ncbi:hypothetical protein Z949_1190 [Sulfitobacter guttiformis KCTC 32187]|nr:hypothetical protein Z949_1190 [Sulfitobacter guttiformis KCTC 32187]